MTLRAPSAWRTLAAAILLACLSGCGGADVFLAFCIGCPEDHAPDVTLGTLPDTANSGDTLLLTATASDDSGFVEQVDFFRVVAGGQAEFLGSDTTRPFEQQTVAPTVSAPTVVQYFARAFDGVGHKRDSAMVPVTVQP